MLLKSRRSPVPQEKLKSNGKDSNVIVIENGLRYLMASSASSAKLLKCLILILILSTSITILNFLILRKFENEQIELTQEQFISPSQLLPNQSLIPNSKPIVWISGKHIERGYLNHVIDVFEKIGYQKTFNGSDTNWDILWSHDYPFMNNFLPQLKPHQRVNHFPGSGFVTNKVNLATTQLKQIPKAFILPREKEQFLEYAKANPKKLWVQKNNEHRGIRIQNLNELNLDTTGTFIQEYISNPLLIDGKKFDIGIYTILTSIDPLRVYIYESDALLRFCAKPYYPFNSSDLDSYVVGDDYTPTWEMPSLQKYFVGLNLNMKDTLNTYLRSKGKDPTKVWKQIEEAIMTVYVAKEEMMVKLTNMFGSPRNFFEMVRFDFALDEDLNVFIMEANMSPNLSSLHFAPNKLLYEQVIFNFLSLAGVVRSIQFPTWSKRPQNIWNMMASDKDLSVWEDLCSSSECHLSCLKPSCQVCYYCLSDEFKLILKDAVLEHLSKWNCKRLLPSTTDEDNELIIPKGEINDMQTLWFKGKCKLDKTWCN